MKHLQKVLKRKRFIEWLNQLPSTTEFQEGSSYEGCLFTYLSQFVKVIRVDLNHITYISQKGITYKDKAREVKEISKYLRKFFYKLQIKLTYGSNNNKLNVQQILAIIKEI